MKKAKATQKTSSKQLTWKEVASKKAAAMKATWKEAHKSNKESYQQFRQNQRRLPSSKRHLRKVDPRLLYSKNKNTVATLKDDNDFKHKPDNPTDLYWKGKESGCSFFSWAFFHKGAQNNQNNPASVGS